MEYKNLTDEELVKIAVKDKQAEEVLFSRYKPMVKKIASRLYIIGGDKDDLMQEGTLGLYGAIKKYDGRIAFSTYAYGCIKSKMVSLVRKYSAKKNIPFIKSVGLITDEDGDIDLTGDIKDVKPTPEEKVIGEEDLSESIERIESELSKSEYQILLEYIQGYSVEDISKRQGKDKKSIDNALYRIRKKLRPIFYEEK